jgi:hypothetical protein
MGIGDRGDERRIVVHVKDIANAALELRCMLLHG